MDRLRGTLGWRLKFHKPDSGDSPFGHLAQSVFVLFNEI